MFYTTAAMVALFVCYLGINTLLAKDVIDAAKQQQLLLNVTDGGAFNGNVDSRYASTLATFENGGSLNLQQGQYQISAFKELVNRPDATLDPIIAALKTGDINTAVMKIRPLIAELDDAVARKETMLVILQFVVALLSLILFVAVIVQILRRAATVEDVQSQSQDETQRILNTVTEGIFLMRSDFEIGIEQSASLKKLFDIERSLEGNFFDFITNYTSSNTIDIARDYIELLFGKRVKERLVEDLNPLKEVQINISRRDGSLEQRYLDFSFKRVMEGKSMSHLMCSVSDVTRRVQLENQLKEAKEEQEAQLELLMNVLQIEPKQLRSFFKTANDGLDHRKRVNHST